MNAFSISQLNGYVKDLFDGDALLCDITVVGEISNFKHHSSGHMYFSLKDDSSAVAAAMFKGQNRYLKFRPENGMKVVAHGRVTVYPPSGSYQIVVDFLQPDGIGELYKAYELLKEKLDKEGLFSPDRKKPIPAFPKRIGVATSPTGAAIRDIVSVISRRFPCAELILAPVQVQGSEAPAQIIEALKRLDEACDVIIVGRGGGSIEDLWCFNDEGVARAVADCRTPVISAVGHETDFTICDFAADLRAATPSAAAELAVPDRAKLLSVIDSQLDSIRYTVTERIRANKLALSAITNQAFMKSPLTAVEICSQKLDAVTAKMHSGLAAVLSDKKQSFAAVCAKLDALNPLGVLARGYSLTYKGGTAVTSVSSVAAGDMLTVKMQDGTIKCQAKTVKGE